jgi:hypothetical protein
MPASSREEEGGAERARDADGDEHRRNPLGPADVGAEDHRGDRER